MPSIDLWNEDQDVVALFGERDIHEVFQGNTSSCEVFQDCTGTRKV